MTEYILFDNSALNYISGQPQHGIALGEAQRSALVEQIRGRVVSGQTVVMVNLAALGELPGLYFSARPRFDLVCRFLFDTWNVRVLRPTFDDRVQPLRTRMEVLAKGKVPTEQALYAGKEWKHLRRAFVEPRKQAMDRYEKDSKERKQRYAAREKKDRVAAEAELKAAGQDWSAEFAGWDNDPRVVVDEWTAFEMDRNRRFYGLPTDKGQWPSPRDFVSLWYARGYAAARLREIFGDPRKHDDRGRDLFDALYFEDAAYSDTFVTTDKGLARRGRSLRLSTPRILLTDEWAAEVLHGPVRTLA